MNTKTQSEKIVDSVSKFRKVLAEINSADEALRKGLPENWGNVVDCVKRLIAILSNDDCSLGGEELLAWRQDCEGFMPVIKGGDEYIARLVIFIGELCASDRFVDLRHNENLRRILEIAMWSCLKTLHNDPSHKLNCYRRLLDADRHYMPYDSCDLLENGDIHLDALADERYWTVCAESPEHFDAINDFAEGIVNKMKQKGINLNAGKEELLRSIKDITKQDSAFLLDLRVLELCADLLKELEGEYAEQKSVFAEKYEQEREKEIKAIQAARAEALSGFQQVFLRAHPSFKGEPGPFQEEFKKGKAEAEVEYDKKIEDCRRKENPYRAEKGVVCAEWRRMDWNSALKDCPQMKEYGDEIANPLAPQEESTCPLATVDFSLGAGGCFITEKGIAYDYNGDDVRAENWCRKAVEQGCIEGFFGLGVIYSRRAEQINPIEGLISNLKRDNTLSECIVNAVKKDLEEVHTARGNGVPYSPKHEFLAAGGDGTLVAQYRTALEDVKEEFVCTELRRLEWMVRAVACGYLMSDVWYGCEGLAAALDSVFDVGVDEDVQDFREMYEYLAP